MIRTVAFGICAALFLKACTAPETATVFESGVSHRNPATPIGVTSRFDPQKFAGVWQVRAFLPIEDRFAEFKFSPSPKGPQVRIAADVCDGGGICGRFAEDLLTRREGKGRFVVTMPDGKARRLWVLWVDEGFRTAVIGNPEGTFAWILDRSAKGGADRIKAAKEILDFNGYKVSQLKVTK